MEARLNGWGILVGVIITVLIFGIGFWVFLPNLLTKDLTDETTITQQETDIPTESHSHTWNVKTVDNQTVKFCKECGKIEQNPTTESHSHTWDVKAVDGEFISFCTECGKIAE